MVPIVPGRYRSIEVSEEAPEAPEATVNAALLPVLERVGVSEWRIPETGCKHSRSTG